MAVLFSKYIDCSMKCLSCLPVRISLLPASNTLRLFLPFSSSSSPSSPSLNVISDFLSKECGFSSSQVATLMRRKPTLSRNKSDHIAREIVHTLTDFGFTENQIKSTILRNPLILTLKADGELKPRIDFLKQIGLDPQDMPGIITRNPHVLTGSLENSLAPRILHLRNLFGSNVHLRQALKRAPDLLTADFERRVKPKVEYVKNYLGISEGTIVFLVALREALSFSFETLENKIKYMANLGLAEDEIRLFLKKCPTLFHCTTKRIKKNMDFLIHTAGLELEIVALNPVLLNLSVEKRLIPRYEVFKYLSIIPQSKDLPSLVTFFKLPEEEFIKRFGQYSTKSSLTIIQSPKASILER
ncbi:transcription termination factor MTEF1, chloroplastic [Cryptomeria japonica]|uniref:transcription termination factor MTEF1, chloroplastic n=1 Tax=Cryptomeria japonica TaxID=3369 RepID=UPI0027DA8629|nr:transcription termination factor MTEF1, chloroplastic [Cryptomeria japonica]